jgi:uncharacterized membrane protein
MSERTVAERAAERPVAQASLAAEGPDRADRRLRTAIGVVALLGLAVAGYLTYVHYAGLSPVCAGGGGGCERVQSSRYAELAGVPVALLGLAGYAAILAALALPGETGRLATAALALAGLGFSLYLTYLELFVIDAVCQWCVSSAVLMTVVAVLAVVRLLRSPEPAGSA